MRPIFGAPWFASVPELAKKIMASVVDGVELRPPDDAVRITTNSARFAELIPADRDVIFRDQLPSLNVQRPIPSIRKPYGSTTGRQV